MPTALFAGRLSPYDGSAQRSGGVSNDLTLGEIAGGPDVTRVSPRQSAERPRSSLGIAVGTIGAARGQSDGKAPLCRERR